MTNPRTEPTVRPRPMGLFLFLAFLSGASALLYESIWIRWFRLLFGSTTYASSATLAAFFGGLALGAVYFGRRAARSERPLRTYAWIELGVAVSALWVPLTVMLYRPLYPMLYEALSGQRELFVGIKLLLALVAMLPTSILLGGTLPMLGTALLGRDGSLGKHGSLLYSVNTLGAALGAALGALFLPEWIGIHMTYGLAVGLSLIVGAISWKAKSGTSTVAPAAEAAPGATDGQTSAATQRAASAPLLIAGASGFGILAFEVLLIHALGQLDSHSAYSFGLVLLTVLTSLGLGAAVVSFTAGRIADRSLLRFSLVLSAALMLVFPWVLTLTGTKVLVLGFFTFLVGGLVFPLTFRLVSGGPAGPRIGGLLAANTVGGILGSLAASFLLLAHVGLWASIGWLGVLYAGAALLVAGAPKARFATLGTVAALGLGIGVSAVSPWSFPSVHLSEGDRLLALDEGVTGIVSVVESAEGNRRMKVDDVYQFGGSKEVQVAERMGHLPLLLHPDPKRVAFVGSATGGVAGSAVLHPVEQIEMVEIVPEVQTLAAEWFSGTNRGVHHDPRTRLITEDGRNHMAATTAVYDTIVEDCFVPYRPSAASMYTRDHYEDVRARLSEGGVFCQWLPIYQLDGETFEIIAATFQEVFPEATLWRTHLRPHWPVAGLVGVNGPLPDVELLESRSADLAAQGIEDAWLTDPANLWMLYVGAVDDIFLGRTRPRAHTDAHPYFEFVTSRYDATVVAQYKYLDWVKLNDRLAKLDRGPLEVFPGRPRDMSLGANAWLRANLAQAGQARDRLEQEWIETARRLPREVLYLRDASFSEVWPR